MPKLCSGWVSAVVDQKALVKFPFPHCTFSDCSNEENAAAMPKKMRGISLHTSPVFICHHLTTTFSSFIVSCCPVIRTSS